MTSAQARLALNGGPKVRAAPFPARGHIGLEEKAAVDALFERAITTGVPPGYNGPEETAYCEAFAAFMGGGYVDAVSSGTAGIYVALKALDLEPFTEVIIGAVTDPGGMMPIPLLNLIPMVADVEPGTYNTGPVQVEALLSPRTSAIIVPHIGGEPADIEDIVALAHAHDIPVIEDCAQAHGARLNGKLVGTFGDIGVFSTMFGKHHSSGGQGGLVYTRDEGRYQAVRRASDRGKPFFLPPDATNVMASLNFNLNDLAAAIGRVQLKKLPASVCRRQDVVAQLREGLEGFMTVSIPAPLLGAEPSYWFLRMRFHADQVASAAQAACEKATFCRALAAEGLPVMPDYRAALPHTQTWFVERSVFGHSGYPWASPDYHGDAAYASKPDRQFLCPNAHAAMDTCFNVQIHENWGTQEVRDALAILEKVEAAYSPSLNFGEGARG